jgi:hypothetical protein
MRWKTVRDEGEGESQTQWYLAQREGFYVLFGRNTRSSWWFVFVKDGQWDGLYHASSSDCLYRVQSYDGALQKAEEYVKHRDPSF